MSMSLCDDQSSRLVSRRRKSRPKRVHIFEALNTIARLEMSYEATTAVQAKDDSGWGGGSQICEQVDGSREFGDNKKHA